METVSKLKHVKGSEDELSPFLCIGDRIALQEFCAKKKALKRESKHQQRKKKCYESIRQKLKLNLQDEESDQEELEGKDEQNMNTIINESSYTGRKTKLLCNTHAEKPTRKIEFGWYHNGTSVRAPNGGGTRKIEVSKDMKKDLLLEEALKLYFPKSKNSKDARLDPKDCTFTLCDYAHEEMAPDISVGEICRSVKMSGILRFFLHSSGPSLKSRWKKTKTQSLESDNTEVPPVTSHEIESQRESFEPVKQTTDLTEVHVDGTYWPPVDEDGEVFFGPGDEEDLSDTLPLFDNTTAAPMEFQIIQAESSDNVVIIADACDGNDVSTAVDSQVAACESDIPADITVASQMSKAVNHQMAASDSDIPANLTPQMPNSEPAPISTEIRVRRSILQQDLIASFIDPNILYSPVTFAFVNERGVDEQGVSRDAYSCFWDQFLSSCAKGEAEQIPTIMPQWQRTEWEAVGRILSKGFIDHGVFPLKMCKVFLIAMIFGEDKVTSDQMLDSLLNYVTETEKNVIQKALQGTDLDDEDQEEFEDMLSRMDCRSVPSGEMVRPMLLHIAQAELIQQSKYALDAMAYKMTIATISSTLSSLWKNHGLFKIPSKHNLAVCQIYLKGCFMINISVIQVGALTLVELNQRFYRLYILVYMLCSGLVILRRT